MATQDDLAAQLKSAIQSSEISQRQLAEDSGVSYVTISRFVSGGRANITIDTAGRLASALGLRLSPAKKLSK